MAILSLDHVNIRTGRLSEMVDWYGRVLGLQTGRRPDFRVNGAWLYVGAHPAIHLVEVAASPQQAVEAGLEHFALGARGLGEFIATLKAHDVAHTIDPVPGYPIVQVNLRDPDGNHIHVDFDEAEMTELD